MGIPNGLVQATDLMPAAEVCKDSLKSRRLVEAFYLVRFIITRFDIQSFGNSNDVEKVPFQILPDMEGLPVVSSAPVAALESF